MEEAKQETEQSAWNLSQQVIQQIGYLLQKASLDYTKGWRQDSFFSAQEITTLIYSDLNSSETKRLEQMEIEIGKNYRIWRVLANKNLNTNLEREEFIRMKIAKDTHAKLVRQYRLFVNGLLGKYGYLIQKKADSSKMF